MQPYSTAADSTVAVIAALPRLCAVDFSCRVLRDDQCARFLTLPHIVDRLRWLRLDCRACSDASMRAIQQLPHLTHLSFLKPAAGVGWTSSSLAAAASADGQGIPAAVPPGPPSSLRSLHIEGGRLHALHSLLSAPQLAATLQQLHLQDVDLYPGIDLSYIVKDLHSLTALHTLLLQRCRLLIPFLRLLIQPFSESSSLQSLRIWRITLNDWQEGCSFIVPDLLELLERALVSLPECRIDLALPGRLTQPSSEEGRMALAVLNTLQQRFGSRWSFQTIE